MEMSKLSENDNALHYATGRNMGSAINGSGEDQEMVVPALQESEEPVRHSNGHHNSRGLDRYEP